MVRENTSLPKMESIRSGVGASGSSTRIGMDTRVGVVTERCASLAGGGRERTEHNHPARTGDTRAYPAIMCEHDAFRLKRRRRQHDPSARGERKFKHPAQRQTWRPRWPTRLTNHLSHRALNGTISDSYRSLEWPADTAP